MVCKNDEKKRYTIKNFESSFGRNEVNFLISMIINYFLNISDHKF